MYNKIKTRMKPAQALILTLITIIILSSYVAILATKAAISRNHSIHNRLNAQAFYIAEGAIENALSQFASAIANYQIAIDTTTYTTTVIFSLFNNVTVDVTLTSLESSDRLVIEQSTSIYERNYRATATVIHPDSPDTSVTLHQIVSRRLIPTFQHAVFYEDDLEIFPGPNMTLSGRIHSNNDIYFDSNNTFTIDSEYLRSAGNIYNKRKDSTSIMNGDVEILVAGSSPAQYEAMNGLDSDTPTWTQDATDRWAGTVRSSAHGVSKITAPSVGSIQPGGHYNNQANVVITENGIVKGGVTLVEGTDYPNGTITVTTTFRNNRENETIEMIEIDLQKLAGADGGYAGYSNNLPENSNGLLYATMTNTTYQPGIRINNGSEIHSSRGLTIVSDDPVYIQGNYNTTNKKPASVISDAVNLLSGNWNDSNSTSHVDSRVAEATSYNCAFITGIDNTTSGHYNGGLENYPRLHEKWSNKNLNIVGSFVALWNSVIAQGEWIYGNPQYKAPRRNWNYDTDFNDINNLPPYTPWAVEMRRIAWEKG